MAVGTALAIMSAISAAMGAAKGIKNLVAPPPNPNAEDPTRPGFTDLGGGKDSFGSSIMGAAPNLSLNQQKKPLGSMVV